MVFRDFKINKYLYIFEKFAKELGILYLDTGAMYRAVALAALERAADLDDEDLENTVFQIIARNRIDTSCGERNLYLITSQSDYDAVKSREVGEKGEPAKIFVIGEGGLEEYFKMNVWFCEYKPINGKIYVNLKCTEKDMKRNEWPLDTVDKTERKSYYVHIKAIDSCDAKAKAQKLFTEYFSKLYDEKSEEYEAELEKISENLYKVRHWNE